MKRKIDTNALQIGMYVSELDRPWLETPFLFQGFAINSQGDINELARYCEFVYIDEELSDYLPLADATPSPAVNYQNQNIEFEKPPAQIAVEAEISRAREVKAYAQEQVADILLRMKSKQQVDESLITHVVTDLFESLNRNPDALLLLGSMKELKLEEEEHAIRVSILALTLGRYMRFSQKLVEEIGVAGLLHDVGKVKIPQQIITDGPGTEEERLLLRRHPEFGAQRLRETHGISESVIDAAYSHHEHVDGTGYPRGLSSDSISLFAKITAIVNVYDNLTQGVQGQGMSATEALRHLYRYRDTVFDAKLTEAFIQCLGIYPVGSLVELFNGEVGIVISSSPGEHLHPRLMLVRTADKRPYKPPRLLNLASFSKGSDKDSYAIRQVLPPNAYGVDMRAYLINENIL